MACRHRQKHEAAVHDTIATPCSLAVNESHGARAAFTFGASLLRAGQPARTDEIEQGHLRRRVFDADTLTVEREVDEAHGPSIMLSGDSARNESVRRVEK